MGLSIWAVVAKWLTALPAKLCFAEHINRNTKLLTGEKSSQPLHMHVKL